MKCACCFTDNPADAQSCVACGQASWLGLPTVAQPAPEATAEEPAQAGLAFTRKKGGR
jgi:hypothetical protein